MANRYVVQTQVLVTPDVYAGLVAGTGSSFLFGEVTQALNRTAAERHRRVFGDLRQVDAVETSDGVALTFEAYTEPAP